MDEQILGEQIIKRRSKKKMTHRNTKEVQNERTRRGLENGHFTEIQAWMVQVHVTTRTGHALSL